MVEKFPQVLKKKSKMASDVVAKSFGKSGRQLEKIQFVDKNISDEDIKKREKEEEKDLIKLFHITSNDVE